MSEYITQKSSKFFILNAIENFTPQAKVVIYYNFVTIKIKLTFVML